MSTELSPEVLAALKSRTPVGGKFAVVGETNKVDTTPPLTGIDKIAEDVAEDAMKLSEALQQPSAALIDPTPKVDLTEKQSVLNKALAILEDYGMRESDIPRNSDYWDLMNKFRSL